MEKQNTEYIEDDFLKQLVKKSETIKPSLGFTEKVMALIPNTSPIEDSEVFVVKPWHYIGLAAGFVAVIYYIISFDLTTFLNRIPTGESTEGINYVNMFGNFLSTFNKAFSAFHFTSVSLMIVISIAVLYFGDKLIKRWLKSNINGTFA